MAVRDNAASRSAEGGSLVEQLPKGTGIEVRNDFDHSWSTGFEVAGHDDEGYLVLRRSDGTVLPRTFRDHEVRRHRKTSSMWWV
jgi:hypothetical protein